MAWPIAASAPGKLFLVGEYAVLDGAPAVLTAIDRRARVMVSPARDSHWRINAPDLDLHGVVLNRDGSLPDACDPDVRARLGVFDAVRDAVAARLGAVSMPPLEVTIDTNAFAREGHKLGLGSSAAVAAALARALTAAGGMTLARAELAMLAIAAHRHAQGGTGSGGDVAASVYGGVISYIRDRPPRPLQWPSALAGLAVVTGNGARTVDMVARVRAYREREPERYAADIAPLRELAAAADQALNDDTRFLRLAADYFEALVDLDRHARAGIVSPRHHELHALARRHDAVFKTSGAGGGDVGLVFVRRGDDEQALRAAFSQVNAEIVPLVFGANGIAIETPN